MRKSAYHMFCWYTGWNKNRATNWNHISILICSQKLPLWVTESTKKIAFFLFWTGIFAKNAIFYYLCSYPYVIHVPHLYHVVTFSGTKIGGVPNCPMFNGVTTYNIGQLGTSLIQCLKISQPWYCCGTCIT